MNNIKEIVELVRNDLNENTTAILDYEDLKDLIKLYDKLQELEHINEQHRILIKKQKQKILDYISEE